MSALLIHQIHIDLKMRAGIKDYQSHVILLYATQHPQKVSSYQAHEEVFPYTPSPLLHLIHSVHPFPCMCTNKFLYSPRLKNLFN